MSPNTQAILIAIGFLFLVIVLPMIYYVKTHTQDQRQKELEDVPKLQSYMLSIVVIISVIFYFTANHKFITGNAAVASFIGILASPLLYKFTRKGPLGKNKTALLFFYVIVDISFLTAIIFYFFQKHA